MADLKPPPAPPRKKGPSLGLILIAVLMVAVSVGVVAAYVPLVPCPGCDGTGTAKVVLTNTKGPIIGATQGGCPPCKNTGKITLFQKYSLPPLPSLELPK